MTPPPLLVRATGETTRRRGWLQSPAHDMVMAFLWLPFAVLAHALRDDAGTLGALVAVTLILSFAHQPLTLWLAYGDPVQRRAHRAFFAWAPLVTVAAVAIGASVQPGLVALVAGAWNIAHTIRQRYGVSRLYGRLGGIDCAGDNRLLWSWLVLAVVVALSSTDVGAAAHDLGLGPRNVAGLSSLDVARPATAVLVPVAAAFAVALSARAVRDEWRRAIHSAPRLVYLGSTAALLAVLAVEPVTGFVAYVGAHAAEYVMMARWRIDRAAGRPTPGNHVAALARRVGSGGTLALYAVAVVILLLGVEAARGSPAAVIATLTLGALHFLYDGVIWRAGGATPSTAPAPAPPPPQTRLRRPQSRG